MTQPDVFVDDPEWPVERQRAAVFLVDASSNLERRLLEAWIERTRPEGAEPETVAMPPSRRRRRMRHIDPGLETRLTQEDDPMLVPIRIAWLAPSRDGKRSVRLVDLLKLGDPRDPDLLRQYLILARAPDRCRVLVGEPASATELRSHWRESVETLSLTEYVTRRAWLALERAERRLRGNRYKVPKFVHEEILGTSEFRQGIVALAAQVDRPDEAVFNRAARYLREIAASHDPFAIDLVANAIHWLYRQGYGAIHYDAAAFRDMYSLGQKHPLVFLPSHKSNLDHLALQHLLWENDAPPNHTAGGINMNFFPVGPIIRRTGVFFIRRTFKDNPLYKFVLRSYIDYLVSRRFPLEWYLEGGRSRSGKLLPPRFGMLGYVADSYRREMAEDVYLIPTSISYDQIHDVRSYAAEQMGTAKEKESFGWLLRSVRTLRRRYGNIHIRFGEPLSIRKELDSAVDADEHSLEIRKIAFEILARINRVTPVTPTSLVTIALLANEDRALSAEDVVDYARGLLSYVEQRRLPTTEMLRLDGTKDVRRVLQSLADHGIVSIFDEGPEAVYLIESDQHLAAAYYRNTIIHFFVNRAIAELALLGATETDRSLETFWEEVMALRDLLKFEFFFSEKETFREEIYQELATDHPDWEEQVAAGPESIMGLLRSFKPLTASWVLRPFFEAYQVVANNLTAHSPYVEIDQRRFIASCLGLGRQYRLQRRIATEESVSQVVFKSALALADNRGLLDIDEEALTDRRRDFAQQIQQMLRRLDAIDALVVGRRAGI